MGAHKHDVAVVMKWVPKFMGCLFPKSAYYSDFMVLLAIAVHCAGFGQGTGPVFLGNLQCSGTESSLLSCSHQGIGNSCSHSYDFGVVCPPGK